MTDEYDNIKHMTHMMGERTPTAQDKIKSRTNGMKEHITGGYDNIKHMTNRMEKSNPNGQCRIK